MTVLTKPSTNTRKPDPEDMLGPLPEEMVEMYQNPPVIISRPKKKTSLTLIFLLSMALLVAITGLMFCLMAIKQYMRGTTVHYQGFCNVPIDIKEYYEQKGLLEPNLEPGMVERMSMPKEKQNEKEKDKENEKEKDKENEKEWATIEWYSLPRDENTGDNREGTLQEEFEIGDTVEKIKVIEGEDKVVSFVHDFENNVTGIVDNDRCFTMPLDPDFTLRPLSFVVNIEKREPFDLTVVHSTLTASVPDVTYVFNMMVAEICANNKKRYQLKKEKSVIRKRSIPMAPAHYIHFAGKGVQEFEITNMAEILEYEKNHA